MIVEIARNVLGYEDADHAETNPSGRRLVVSQLTCSLASLTRPVRIVAGSRAGGLYQTSHADEEFWCNYGVNPAFEDDLRESGLVITGLGEEGEPRIVELPAHPFFVATLFLPQKRSMPGHPHPLLRGFVDASQVGPRPPDV